MIMLDHSINNHVENVQSIYNVCSDLYANHRGTRSNFDSMEDIDLTVQMTFGDVLGFTYQENVFVVKFDSGISEEMQTVLQASPHDQMPKAITDKFNPSVGEALQSRITSARHVALQRIVSTGKRLQQQRAEQLLAEYRLKGIFAEGDTVESLQRKANRQSVSPVAYAIH